jgi:hypothetical protein
MKNMFWGEGLLFTIKIYKTIELPIIPYKDPYVFAYSLIVKIIWV